MNLQGKAALQGSTWGPILNLDWYIEASIALGSYSTSMFFNTNVHTYIEVVVYIYLSNNIGTSPMTCNANE
jgi:hypothetical protein